MSLQTSLGVISYKGKSDRRDDYLYRVSIKCFIRNERGEVLVVKEAGRTYWDLPGGGMDHGEDIKATIAREMKEEVNLEGAFTYRIIATDEPAYLENHDFWQLRLIFEVTPENLSFSVGEDGDEIAFRHPQAFESSPIAPERCIYDYSNLL